MKDFLHIEKVFLSCQTREHREVFVAWLRGLIKKGVVKPFEVETYDQRLRSNNG